MKKEFELEKTSKGTITIKDELRKLSIGFYSPDGGGIELDKMLDSLKSGDRIVIRKKEKEVL